MQGMPRRYYDYPAEFGTLHLISTIGAYLNGLGYTAALGQLFLTGLFGKVKAPSNPYNSLGLEWQTQSPPIHENFPETPIVEHDPYHYGKAVVSHH
jgi:cytochrome c oxidase subunit 1